MAEKLGILNQMLFGNLAERATINRNAEHLSNVAAELADLGDVVNQQAEEITRLRAMVMGLVDVLQSKATLHSDELELAVDAAWTKLVPPKPSAPPAATDPYRNLPVEASAAEIDAAKALLATAQDHHFGRRFAEARAVY